MTRQKLIFALLLIVITPIGILTKFYSGPAEEWVNHSLGGLFYEIFWCLVVAFIFTKIKPVKIALWVFVITCTLEFLQKWHPPFMEYMRNNFIGQTILGNSFNWMDFPYYVVGSVIGYVILISITMISNKSNTNPNT